MTKILIIITTSFVPWGGLTTVAMNYYRGMDKMGLQIDFASCNMAPQSLIDEVKQNHGQYTQLPDRKKKTLHYMKALYQLLKREKYDVVHIHGNSATMTFDLLPSVMAGVKKRIVHVHNSRNQHNLAHAVLYPFFNKMLTDRICVSEVSGKYLYKKNAFIVLNNAIDTRHYCFQKELREECRRSYGISEDAYVIGTVGKINYQKNHSFLIAVFAEVLKVKLNAKLLIVGGGELADELKLQIQTLGIEESCILAGMQDDTAAFLSAMDAFVFPSLFEGLPLSLIEAQASGLPCIVSDNVTEESNVTGKVVYVSLDDGVRIWSAKIRDTMNQERLSECESNIKLIKQRGFDIYENAGELRKIYLG